MAPVTGNKSGAWQRPGLPALPEKSRIAVPAWKKTVQSKVLFS